MTVTFARVQQWFGHYHDALEELYGITDGVVTADQDAIASDIAAERMRAADALEHRDEERRARRVASARARRLIAEREAHRRQVRADFARRNGGSMEDYDA